MKNILDKFMYWLGYVPIKELDKLEESLASIHREQTEEIHKMYEVKLEKTKYPKFIDERRIGNSTRIADWYIQELFIKGKIKVIDHYGTYEANKFLFKTITRRLKIEHGNWSVVKIDENKLTIELIGNK